MLNYFKPNSKKAQRALLALKAMMGTIGGAAYFQGSPQAGFWLLVSGAAIDFLVTLFSDGTDDQNTKGNTPSYIEKALVFIGVVLLLSSCAGSKKSHSTFFESKTTDSSWIEKKSVPVPVRGSTTAGVNLDSLKKALLSSVQPGMNLDSFRQILTQAMNQPGANVDSLMGVMQKMYAKLLNKFNYISDTSGKLFMKYWVDSMGNLMAQCEQKDQIVQALVDQNNRLIKQNQVTKEETYKKVYRWPPFMWWILAAAIVVVLYLIISGLSGRFINPLKAVSGIFKKGTNNQS